MRVIIKVFGACLVTLLFTAVPFEEIFAQQRFQKAPIPNKYQTQSSVSKKLELQRKTLTVGSDSASSAEGETPPIDAYEWCVDSVNEQYGTHFELVVDPTVSWHNGGGDAYHVLIDLDDFLYKVEGEEFYVGCIDPNGGVSVENCWHQSYLAPPLSDFPACRDGDVLLDQEYLGISISAASRSRYISRYILDGIEPDNNQWTSDPNHFLGYARPVTSCFRAFLSESALRACVQEPDGISLYRLK
jgi:hypothetical protein